jgi:hypothetical protein
MRPTPVPEILPTLLAICKRSEKDFQGLDLEYLYQNLEH